MPRTITTTETEWLRTDGPALPFCSVHGGDSEMAINGGGAVSGLVSQNVVNAIPIRPRAPVVLGEDPYNSEPVAMAGDKTGVQGALRRIRHRRMLESLELGDKESEIPLPRPQKLDIQADDTIGFRW